MLDVEVCLEIWQALKHHLIGTDIEAAADDFVHVLIENGISAEVLAEYAIDIDVKKALKEYADIDDYDDYDDEDELDFG
jgi:hypothetical protein